MTRTLRIAAAQYPLDKLDSIAAYEHKITRWVNDAAAQDAELLVFPEYGAMELCAIGNRGHDLQDSITAVSDFIPEIIRIHQGLAKKHGLTIISGSAPQRRGAMTCNVAHVFGPNGKVASFDKIMPTPWERDPWNISAGRELKLFDLGKAKLGLLICYDIEFPLLSRALAEAGAELIAAPSNTETAWGYWRVRIGAAARALENQVYTIQSPVIGPAPFCAACETNTGMAGIFAPPDRGFPEDGVMALGVMNQPQWIYATIDLEQIARVRHDGGVRTFQHWSEQPGAGPLPTVTIIDMTGSP